MTPKKLPAGLEARPAWNNYHLVASAVTVTIPVVVFVPIELEHIEQVFRQKTLIILVKNPEAYVERGNPLKRAANKANYKMCGSPIAITANTLQIGFPELLSIFQQYQQKFGQALKASQ
ncbi:MAG TPA: STM3941 family protein [Candidatus Angelobacter sp.]